MKRPSFTAAQRLETFKAFGAIVCCQATGCDNAIAISEAEIDHYVALIDGGKHDLENLRPICRPCHRKKSAREHRNNAKAKRLAKARETHEAVVKREAEKARGSIRSRGFNKGLRRKVSGKVEQREQRT